MSMFITIQVYLLFGFNLKMKDRLQYLTNHGFLDLISPTVRSKQTVVKKTRFVNDSQHDNAVGLDTMQHLKIMSSFPHKQENDCIKNNDSLSTNKLQKDKRQELLNEHFILRKPMAQTLLLDLLQQEVTDVSQPPKPSRPAAQPLATKRIPENVSNMTNISRYRSYPTGAHIFRGDPKRNDVQAQFPQRTMLNRTPAIRLRRPPNSQNRGNVLNERSSHQKGGQHKLPENNVTCVVQSNHSSRSSSCETLSVWTVEDEIKKLIYGDEFNQKVNFI